jgi:hypothetical protein
MLRITHPAVNCPWVVIWCCNREESRWEVKKMRGRSVHIVSTHQNPKNAERAARKLLFDLRRRYTKRSK